MSALFVDDDAFVRAPRPLVYRRLTDVGAWSSWWPGLTARRLPDVDGRETWSLDVRRDLLRGLRVTASLHSFRHEVGFALRLAGDVAGQAEYWLEDVEGGVVVHHVLVGSTGRRVLPTLVTYRAVVRRGMFGLKDVVQTEVRTAVGLRP